MSLLVLNTGSSNLKLRLFDDEAKEELASSQIEWDADRGKTVEQIRRVLRDKNVGADSVRGVGHRVVHGGERFHESIRVDSRVKAEIARLAELAPLHNPAALEGIEAAEAALPGVPQVAVFDTSLFARLPPRAFLYPVPYDWYTRWGIRRFGFHGISHAYCADRAAELLNRKLSDLLLITCHLGNGCSATAFQGGVPVATSMGFTPMDGMMMGTRPGSLDPGVLVHLLKTGGMSADQLDDALNHQSGLLGVSGVSSDFRAVEAAAKEGNERARLALDIYADRARSVVGAFATTMGGVDVLVFTAGVGENSASLRAQVCAGLECLGLRLDGSCNKSCQLDMDVAADNSSARILVIRTREEQRIAVETRKVVLSG
jgi:acetate kinase